MVVVSALCFGSKCRKDVELELAVATVRVAEAFTLDRPQAHSDLTELTRGPHPLGTPRQAEIADWLANRAQKDGGHVVREPFMAKTPNPGAATGLGPVALTSERPGVNLWVLPAHSPPAPCAVVLASHYDTKMVAGAAYVGANDSGSSTAALLQLLKYIGAHKLNASGHCALIGVFFDGEEAVLPQWRDGEDLHPSRQVDHTYGSRFNAQRLAPCAKADRSGSWCLPADIDNLRLSALILMDMIGSPNMLLARDENSTPELLQWAIEHGRLLQAPAHFATDPQAVDDDHVPYRDRGLPVLDLIDFTNVDLWHRPGDELGALEFNSIETAARLALSVGLRASRVAASASQGSH